MPQLRGGRMSRLPITRQETLATKYRLEVGLGSTNTWSPARPASRMSNEFFSAFASFL